MRMTWARRKASPLASVDRMHFVMWDFLRMFLAAVVCGVAVSVVAAGIALLLARDAYAAPPPQGEFTATTGDPAPGADPSAGFQPYPGMLLIGSGCDAEVVDATERDWKVTINGNSIDVRVMQTFIVPDGDTSAVSFNALLPSGARLLRLTAHTPGGLWQGRIFDADSLGQFSGSDFRNHSRNGLLIVQNEDGDISTDSIINIAATDAVTVEYTYRLDIDEAAQSHSLTVPLGNDNTPLSQAAGWPAASAAVWVEWTGGRPIRLVDAPGDATLETAGPRITGLSWATPQPGADARFHLAWSK